MIYFKKSMPEPEGLATERAKASGKYTIASVLHTLANDFQNKCYICEYKNPSTINVEHFKPHKNNHTLKFDWSNLFLACSHCNNIKNDGYENILNCTDLSDDVENSIKIHIDPIPFKEVEVYPLRSDIPVVQTAQLLEKVYNGTTTMKKMESNDIREALVDEILAFLTNLKKYFSTNTIALKERLKLEINEQLDSSSPFTMFKRCIIKENTKLMEEFGDFITMNQQTDTGVETS